MSEKNQNKKKLNDELLMCPNCKNHVTINPDQLRLLNSEPIKDITIECPVCGNLYNISQINKKVSDEQKFKITKETEQVTGTSNNLFFKIPPFITATFIGILFTISGSILLYISLIQNLKIGIALIIVGTLCLFLVSEKKRSGNVLLFSEKITIIISIWICISFLLTYYADLTIFFITLFIGFLIIKELLNPHIPKNINLKLRIIVLSFFATYILLIVNTIVPYLTS